MSGIAAGPGIIVMGPEEFAAETARLVAETIVSAVEARGTCSIALSGGNTPRPVYHALGTTPISDQVPWDGVELFFADERAVPPHDVESNFGMVLETLLDDLPMKQSQVHRMEAERSDRAAAAIDTDRLLPAELDLLILGMGADGHTASLFPRSTAVQERVRRVVPVSAPKPPALRMSITPPVIAAARVVIVLVTGADKAATVARVHDRPYDPALLPAQFAQQGTWILDRAAASMLPRKGHRR